MPNLYLERVTKSAIVPIRKTDYAACYDVQVNLEKRNIKSYGPNNKTDITLCNGVYELFPGERAMIPTGWKMSCDPGWKIEIAPRSGNALKKGLTLINCVGIIDADYPDEVMLLITNHSNTIIEITDGMRLGQLSLERVEEVNMFIGTLPSTTSNRTGGIGSTDK